ncbi:lipopolysaccharide biosynthesis protein [Hyphomicrobium sp.]|uniref:lipopolysaccharide biosynthesis protein n=1 Tax=Hyphomicrobium sp. TaxID=82 RepID=UPI002D80C58C|nr:lipopolysaccharide biosynthesis protein [Hyphomicrobium sp.]
MAGPASPPQRSSGRHMLHGSFWMILLRWTLRLIGLVSTIILARLLTPADFGIVSMAMIVVGILEVLNQTGQQLAIIRLEHPTRDDYDAAWTISALVGVIIAVAILIVAPFTQAYFHEPRAVIVMQCLALRAFLSGLENVGVVDFRRDVRFDRFFTYNAYPKIFSFFVTIGLAWYLRNYWALVGGILANQASRIVLSYIMHAYRPRISFKKVAGLWSFSTWTLLRSIGITINSQVDQIIIGGISGVSAMGRYSVASDIAATPSREVNEPLVTVLYSVMAKFQSDMGELRSLFLRTLGWSTIICSSTSVGVALVAPELVPLVLGHKWLDVEPLMGWLALSAGALGFGSTAYILFDLIGKPHLGARMQWVRLVMLAILLAPVGLITRDLYWIAVARFVVTVVFLPTLFIAAGRHINVSLGDYINVFWRPLLAAAIMALAVEYLRMLLAGPDFLRLIASVSTGALVYTGTLLLLWRLSGRPASPEQDLLGIVRGVANKFLIRERRA